MQFIIKTRYWRTDSLSGFDLFLQASAGCADMFLVYLCCPSLIPDLTQKDDWLPRCCPRHQQHEK